MSVKKATALARSLTEEFAIPIDGRDWHSHRRYEGLDHGCEWEGDHGTHERLGGRCQPHPHTAETFHLIDIGLDCGVVYGPARKTDGQQS